jgi:hypothetical protein
LRYQEEIRDGQKATNTELLNVSKMMAESKAEHQAQATEHQEQAAIIRDNRDQIMQALTRSNKELADAINLNSTTSERIHNSNAKMWRERFERERMSNITYAQVMDILEAWGGTPEANLKQWETTYNFIIPPPPPPTALISNSALAAHICSVYRGPAITG